MRVSWFGWMLLSATAMAAWLTAQVVLGWWGIVAGFVVGGVFCSGMAWGQGWRAAADPGRRLPRCAECGAAVAVGRAVCRRCGGLVVAPGAAQRIRTTRRDGAGPAATETGDSLVDAISRATAPAATQLSANYTWRNWGGVLLIMAGLTGALGLSALGLLAPMAALGAGVGGGLAMLRWGTGGD